MLVPGYVGRAAPIRVKRGKLSGSRKVYSKAARLRHEQGLQAVDMEFMMSALNKLPEQLVVKCAIAARELGKNPARYFIACVRNEIAQRPQASS